MRFCFKYIFAAICLSVCFTGCDDKLEVFEESGYMGIPQAFDATSVRSEALPGSIKLNWNEPTIEFAYMQIRYQDPLLKKEVCKIVSKGTTELVVENTRARFGDYTFRFQTFNATHEGSDIVEVKAKSGAAPVTLTEKNRTKVELRKEQLSTDNQEPREGPIANLIDGNIETFFHTRWSGTQVPLPQYIQIDLEDEHQDFAIKYTTRKVGNKDGFPTAAELQISSNGNDWETVATLSGLPASSATDYVSSFVRPGKKFKYFRFLVTSSSLNKKYFHMSEFSFYDVDVEVYDPETVPLD